MKLLGMERCGWDELGHGRNGYRKGLYFASISILYDGNPGMGACLDMSGQGSQFTTAARKCDVCGVSDLWGSILCAEDTGSERDGKSKIQKAGGTVWQKQIKSVYASRTE
ncbi:hypothetical protein [uncultured Oscillibacter sp.]|uniref:hypothetical protein n=1 Tax=uncultured Oscillibacter sp. TaxID=876091 RepID=UPI0034547EAA